MFEQQIHDILNFLLSITSCQNCIFSCYLWNICISFWQIVLSGFGSGEQHLKLTTVMFQNIFLAIDINTVSALANNNQILSPDGIIFPCLNVILMAILQVKLSSCQRIVLLNYNKDTKLIDFRHYSIRLQPVGVSKRIRKFVQNHQVPDLKNLQDVSDFITK